MREVMQHPGSWNPWVSVWTSPRVTIARIVQENPNRGLWWLAAIYGFSGLLNFLQSIFLGAQMGVIPIFLLALVIGPLWGYASFSVWSAVVWWTGKWIKGTAHFKAVRAAYAWSCVPFIINIVLWVVMAALFGRLLFMNFAEGYAFTQGEVIFLFFILLARIAVGIWSLVIYLNALAEVQNFSVLRAIGNVLIAAVLMGVVFWLISLLFTMAQGQVQSTFIFSFLTNGG
jgi:hypothetical protein